MCGEVRSEFRVRVRERGREDANERRNGAPPEVPQEAVDAPEGARPPDILHLRGGRGVSD